MAGGGKGFEGARVRRENVVTAAGLRLIEDGKRSTGSIETGVLGAVLEAGGRLDQTESGEWEGGKEKQEESK